MIWGLLAALGWGGADVLGAVSGRRIGSVRTVLIAQVVSLVIIWAVVVLTQTTITVTGPHALMLLGSGIPAGLAYLSLYRALELGPVALVSPIVAAFGAITITLALLFFGESITPIAGAAIALTLVGVVLAAADLRAIKEGGMAHLQGGGIPWAIGSMIAFGVASLFLGQVSGEIGPVPATSLARTVNVATVLVFVALSQRAALRGLSKVAQASLGIAALTGVVDIGGTFAFAIGTSTAATSLVTAVSVALVIPPLLAGLLFFGERPAVSQYIGIGVVVAGLLLLSVTA